MAQQSSQQLVITRVGGVDCGIDIESVLEILPARSVTPVPEGPPNIVGMLNVRGAITPIADFRGCLGFPMIPFTNDTRFVLVNSTEGRIGLVVDAVTEVLTIEADAFRSMAGTVGDAPSVKAVAQLNDRLILSIDHDRAIRDGLSGAVRPLFRTTAADLSEETKGGLQVELLESSFALLAPRGEELVARFYDKLFTVAPAARALFPEDLGGQRKALLGALGTIVNSLRSPEKLAPYLQGLGGRHAGYGAAEAHYDVVGQVLLGTMAELAGDAWTPALEAAWTEAYMAVAGIMLGAAPGAVSAAA
jgi:chemotaxis signal transduction protein/hemoglobin-like flavoprotein